MTKAFMLTNCEHGALLVNRFDYAHTYENKWFGLGAQILENGCYDPGQVAVLKQLLVERRARNGDGVVVLDCGANIGVFTLEFANLMSGWGQVFAIEAQERLFYALAGNITLHNAFNARAIWSAVGAEEGFLDIPEPDYCEPGSFGSLELRQALGNQNIGQPIDYSKPTSRVQMVTIDGSDFDRVDLIKLDVEGMELEALAGARETIARCRPMIFMEIVKQDKAHVEKLFDEIGYEMFPHGSSDMLAVHRQDPIIRSISLEKQASS